MSSHHRCARRRAWYTSRPTRASRTGRRAMSSASRWSRTCAPRRTRCAPPRRSRIADKNIELVQIGEALDERFAREAKDWTAREPRYRWLGGLAHERALAWMAKSHALVVSSVMEGGANVVAEAARIGTPVIASRIPGNVGMLGERYPGYYPVADDAALADVIARAKKDQRFYRSLQTAIRARRKLFAPAAERAALLRVVREALHLRSSATRARTASLDQSSSP